MSTYVPIQTITLSANTSSVDFTGIPQTYRDLILIISGKNASSTYSPYIQFNSDGNANYSQTDLRGDGATASSTRSSNTATIYQGSLTASDSVLIYEIQNYSNITTNKTALWRLAAPTYGAWSGAILYRSTSAITSLKILNESPGNFASGTNFTLYGMGTGSPKAFGGTTVTTDGTYWYHTFRSSGQFTPTQALTADYLVVAGGGSGGNNAAGGGGAGGLRSTVTATGGGGSLESSISLNSNVNYTVTVGAGAPINSTVNGNGISGSNSVFASITSNGGSGGMGALGTAVPQGGSGGGAFYAGGTPGAGTTGQGYAGGGGGGGGSTSGSGGGGGAGGIGGNRSGTTGGTGGAGVSVSISGSSVTYAGGGGGGGSEFGTGGNGGSGGGGRGCDGSANNAANGTANTGGGGGGGSYAGSNPGSFGAGGSGIVIVRYSV